MRLNKLPTVVVCRVADEDIANCVPKNDPLGTYVAYASAQSNVGGTDQDVGELESHVNGCYIYCAHLQYA
jgi:hypothetical protein